MGLFSFFKVEKSTPQKMGYKSDQDGIITRYAREKDNWDIHLAHSKQVILDAVKHFNAQSVSILGSGWLLDVPLDELSLMCSQVYLYDIVHPAQIRNKVSKYRNVATVDCDVTGGMVEKIWTLLQKKDKSLAQINRIEHIPFRPLFPTDLIISLNLLNQLDIILCDFIIQNSTFKSDDLMPFRRSLQQNHIDSLQQANFCLITDYNEKLYDFKDAYISSRPLIVVPFPEKQHQQNWEWKFDSSGFYYDEKKVIFDVKALY